MQAVLPGQEPLQEPRFGSAVKPVSGPTPVTCRMMTKGLVWLPPALRPLRVP
jgi:hypothetical protein